MVLVNSGIFFWVLYYVVNAIKLMEPGCVVMPWSNRACVTMEL